MLDTPDATRDASYCRGTPLDWNPGRDLVPAIADKFHLPLSPDEEAAFSNSTFVDDNAVTAYRPNIRQVLHQSIVSAYISSTASHLSKMDAGRKPHHAFPWFSH